MSRSIPSARIPKAELFSSLPAAWPHDPTPAIRAAVQASGVKVVVLDDDPTGTQTVHGVPVLTEWPVAALAAELQNDLPALYLLTNSRSLPPAEAHALNAEIGRNLVAAGRASGRRFAVISRGDSTLRGHYPGEVDALAAALGERFDATLLIPFFEAGGRYTVGDVHYVAEGDELVPAGETAFARDGAFGYRASNLREWVAEKTGGKIPASAVASISLEENRSGGPDQVAARLLALPPASVCVVNAASARDLDVFTAGLLQAEAEGRRFLYRTAASFVPARAGIAPRPLLRAAELGVGGPHGGLVIVGSYVPTTSGQIRALLEQPDVAAVEVRVDTLLNDAEQAGEIARAAQAINARLERGQDAVIYTSRRLITGNDAADGLAIGQRVSASLVAIARGVTRRPRYVLAKGGITSSDIATGGLGVRRAMVLGQLLPGVPVWQLGPESRFPRLAYVVFPGNVGGPNALADAVAALQPAE